VQHALERHVGAREHERCYVTDDDADQANEAAHHEAVAQCVPVEAALTEQLEVGE